MTTSRAEGGDGNASSGLAKAPARAEGGSPPHLGSRLMFWIAMGLLMFGFGVLQLKLIRVHGLWTDEIFSVAMATGHSLEHPAALADVSRGDFVEHEAPVSVAQIRQYGQHRQPAAPLADVLRAVFLSDTSPPLYYVFLHYWTRVFGVSDGDVRSLSVLFALASIPLVMLLARRLAGSTGGIWAGVLLVASPHFIYFGGEARMYSLLWFWVVATAWLTVRTEGPVQARRRLGLWALTSVAGFLTHYFFLFPWVLFVAFLVLHRRRPPRQWTIAACAVVVLLLLPWYWHVPESLRNWRVTQDWLSVPPGGFVRWRAALELFTQYYSGQGQHVWWDHPIAQTFALALFAALLVPAVRRERVPWGRGERLLPWAWWVVVCMGPLVFDAAKNTYTVAVPRYGLMALPAVCLIGAMGLMNFGVIGRTLLGLGIVAAWVPQTWGIFQDVDRNDQRYWHIGWVLDREATGKDLVLVHSIPSGVLGVARYTHTAAQMAGWVVQLGSRRLPESIDRLIAGKSRVFYINIHSVGADVPEERWLRERFRVIREERISSSPLVVFDVEREPIGGATRPAPR